MNIPTEPYRHSQLPTIPKGLYLFCGAMCMAMIASLPLVDVDITVRSPAVIRPSAPINIIRSHLSGRVSETFLIENKTVKPGDPLLVLESFSLAEQEHLLRSKIESGRIFARDLEKLVTATTQAAEPTNLANHAIPLLQSEHYQRDFARYRQRIIESLAHQRKARQDFDRNLKLFNEQVIPASEFENYQFELKACENSLQQIRDDEVSQWSEELKSRQEELSELESQLSRTIEERTTLTIRAPVRGSVQNPAGIYPGSFVSVNQVLGEISPDTSLVAMAYVHPSDIGLIQINMPVRMQVDAFHYQQWGMAEGRVIEVPQDIRMLDNKPSFEVRCSLDRNYLQLKSGYKGFLKKGMSVQAHFVVTRRSLWQLLYDKVDNWMNPALSSKGH